MVLRKDVPRSHNATRLYQFRIILMSWSIVVSLSERRESSDASRYEHAGRQLFADHIFGGTSCYIVRSRIERRFRGRKGLDAMDASPERGISKPRLQRPYAFLQPGADTSQATYPTLGGSRGRGCALFRPRYLQPARQRRAPDVRVGSSRLVAAQTSASTQYEERRAVK